VALTSTTLHEKEEFAVYNNIIQYITDYTQLSPAGLVKAMAV
jgi:beta-phosphoglucomutase